MKGLGVADWQLRDRASLVRKAGETGCQNALQPAPFFAILLRFV